MTDAELIGEMAAGLGVVYGVLEQIRDKLCKDDGDKWSEVKYRIDVVFWITDGNWYIHADMSSMAAFAIGGGGCVGVHIGIELSRVGRALKVFDKEN